MPSSALTGGSWKMGIPIWKMLPPERNICLKVPKASSSKKEVYMPASGTMDYVLVFEPLPSETQTIHFLNPTDPEGNIYDISLVPQKKKKSSPLAIIKGNWFKTDGSGSWEYGVYDSISILNNRIYTNENIRKKGKRIEMALKDKQSHEEITLSLLHKKTERVRFNRKEQKK